MNLPPADRPPLPGLRLPLGRRRSAPGVALALFLHVAVIGALLVRGRALLQRAPGGPGSSRDAVNFFALPAAGAPAAVDVAVSPRLTLADLSALPRIPVELPPLDLSQAMPPVPVAAPRDGAGNGGGGGGAGGTGSPGAGMGSGTGDEAGYIFPASPRTAILPPLAKVPGSVAGHTYHVKFWVSAEGRVTLVEVDPPIADAAYGREFQQRMMAYQFYPAHTRDGRNVTYVVTVPLRIGN